MHAILPENAGVHVYVLGNARVHNVLALDSDAHCAVRILPFAIGFGNTLDFKIQTESERAFSSDSVRKNSSLSNAVFRVRKLS